MLTKEQYKILSNYTKHLNSAKCDYIRGVYSRDIEAVRPIYESLGNKFTSPNCSYCVLQMFKVLSQEYDKYTARYHGKEKSQ